VVYYSKWKVKEGTEMSPEEIFEANLEDVEAVARSICKRHYIYGKEADDFVSSVKEKLIEDDFRRIRAYRGISTFRAYLHTVISRIYSDQMRKIYGRYRPSAKAKSLGPVAVILECLINERHSFDEAYEILTTNHCISITKKRAYEIYCKLPEGKVRGLSIDVGDEELLGIADTKNRPDQMLLNKELLKEKEEVLLTLEKVREKIVKSLSEEDRLILKMKFQDDMETPKIAKALNRQTNYVNRRIRNILSMFKREILSKGISEDDAIDVIKDMEGEDNA